MIIERLCREHRNTERLLAVLERELAVFDFGGHPDYEVVRAIICYFQNLLSEVYHHPQEHFGLCEAKNSRSCCGCKGR